MPLNEGDSILRSGPSAGFGHEIRSTERDYAEALLRRVIVVRSVGSIVDAFHIEARAHALGAKALSTYAARFWTWLTERA